MIGSSNKVNGKQRSSRPSRVQLSNDNLSDEFTKLKKKHGQTYSKILNVLDNTNLLLTSAISNLQEPKDVQVIDDLDKKLMEMKPLKSVREAYIHFYNKLSSFMRAAEIGDEKIQKQMIKRYNDWDNEQLREERQLAIVRQKREKENEAEKRLRKFMKNKLKESELLLIQEMLYDHFLRIGEWKSAQIFKPNVKEQVIIKQEQVDNVKESVEIDRQINNILNNLNNTEKMLDQEDENFSLQKNYSAQQFVSGQPTLFNELYRLKSSILNGNYEEAITWCFEEQLYETYSDQIEYELRKIKVLKLIGEGKSQEALKEVKAGMGRFWKQKEEEVGMLLGYMFWGMTKQNLMLLQGKITANHTSNSSKIKEQQKDQPQMNEQTHRINQNEDISQDIQEDPPLNKELNGKSSQNGYLNGYLCQIPERYQIFKLTHQSNSALANRFSSTYLKHYNIPPLDSFQLLYSLSTEMHSSYLKAFSYLQNSDLNNSSTTLPIQIQIPSLYKFHSVFFCPITKELMSWKDGVVLLVCGHMISQTASNRIITENRGRKKYKCPICQKDIKAEENLRVQF